MVVAFWRITYLETTVSNINRYDEAVRKFGLGASHHLLLTEAAPGETVLEIGPATGYMTRLLREKGCIVDIVEIDGEAARQAAVHARQAYIGSVEDAALLGRIQSRYDAVLFADVLEHLKDPRRVLEEIRLKLKPSGRVLASIPNVAHWTVRWKLLLGQFHYEEIGLLDRTHLRFFTLQTARELFEESGYHIVSLRFTVGVLPIVRSQLNQLRRFLVSRFPSLFAWQFIIDARPTNDASVKAGTPLAGG